MTTLSRSLLAFTAAGLVALIAACATPKSPQAGNTPSDTTAASAAPAAKPAAADAVSIVRPATDLPPAISRRTPEKVVVKLETVEVTGRLADRSAGHRPAAGHLPAHAGEGRCQAGDGRGHGPSG